jgi:predicted ribosomally synthesized peptide with nif11-like leader
LVEARIGESTIYAMSEDQLSALLAKLKDDAGLQEKLKGVADLDGAVAIAKEAGFDVSKADLLKHQAKQTLELSDEELEGVAGGGKTNSPPSCRPGPTCAYCPSLGEKNVDC